MIKEKYDRTKLEIFQFRAEDIISTSGSDDEYEGWNPGGGSGSGDSEYEGWKPHEAVVYG